MMVYKHPKYIITGGFMSRGTNLENLLNEYLLDIRLKNYSVRTLKSVKNNNMLFFAFLESEYGITTLEKVSHVHLKAYFKHKQSLGLKATYINSILRNIRMFFNYLEHEEYISNNYIKKVSWQKEDRVIIKSFTDQEVAKMLKVYDYSSYINARNACIMAMLFDTGIRNSELCYIRMIDVKSNAILIFGKGKKERFVPITPSLAKIMLKYEQKRNIFVKEDEDWCLYRDLGNGYDIEINLKGTRRAKLNASVYVWQVRDQLKVIRSVESINDVETLRRILRCMINQTDRLAAKRNKIYKPIMQAV